MFMENGSGGFMGGKSAFSLLIPCIQLNCMLVDLVFNGGKPNAVSGRDLLSHLMDRQVWYLGRESAVSHCSLQQSGITE